MVQNGRYRRSRSETRALLIQSALDILHEGGVLGGLSLRDVAFRAGVNHGQIYEYFGDRRTLLREAVRQRVSEDLGASPSADYWRKPFTERRMDRFARTLENAKDEIDLTALLAIDGDESFRLMPFLNENRKALARDVENGSLSDSVDPMAAHVLSYCVARGYALFREGLAREIECETEELDQRVLILYQRLLQAMSDSARLPAPGPPSGGR